MLKSFLKSACGLCVVAAAVLAGSEMPAGAADLMTSLGGDCCADLETRVANLEATTARKGNRKVSLTISGRVNASVMWWSENSTGPSPAANDQTHDVYFGNSTPDTRDPNIVFSGDGKISGDLTAGFSLRIDAKFGGGDTQTTVQSGPVLSSDITYVFLRSKALGELRLGNMYSASDDAYYLNFGGGTVGGISGANHTGSFLLRDVNGALSNTSYFSALGEMSDNLGDTLMYISPTVGGLTVKASVGGEDTAAASATWIGKFNSVEVEAGAGYQVSHGIDGDCAGKGGQCLQLFDTASAGHPWSDAAHTNLRALGLSGSVWDTASGLYLSGAYSRVYADASGRQDPANWFVQAGWIKNVSGLGATTLYGSYDRTDNKIANDTSAHYWNLGVDQAFDSAASNLYLHYQHDSLDSAGAVTSSTGAGIATQSIDSVTGGMVVHF